MTTHCIAFWNVENLFDVEDWADRPAWLQKTLKSELQGWTQAILDRKLDRLAEIIGLIDDGRGPDAFGVCEVESDRVLNQLRDLLAGRGRHYQVAHVPGHDGRGIDVAFLFDGDRYDCEAIFSHVILKRTGTRDLFQINLKIKASGRDLILIGNHWPSRRGGALESEPYRMLAGETLSYWHERILEEKGRDVAIVAMGDFNDEPFNRSITDYALAINSRAKVTNAHNPVFLNLMWPVMGSGRGSHYFENSPNVLDQFLISRDMVLSGTPLAVRDGSVRIEAFPQMVRKGAYPGPLPFGRPFNRGKADPSFTGEGYSDHFPISLIVEER